MVSASNMRLPCLSLAQIKPLGAIWSENWEYDKESSCKKEMLKDEIIVVLAKTSLPPLKQKILFKIMLSSY